MVVDTQIKILLVEDAGTMRKMEIRILNQLGFENIIEAVDGNDAVAKLEAESGIELVISDWAMPGMNGHQLLCWMRERDPFQNIPFLMATGHGDKAYTAQALESGANGVVPKPFSPDELRGHIDKVFGVEEEKIAVVDERPKVSAAGKVQLKMAHIQITDHLTLGVLRSHIKSGKVAPHHFDLETLCMPSWNPVQDSLEKGEVDGAFILAPMAMDLFSYGVPIRMVLLAHRNGSIMVRNKALKYSKPYQQFFKHKTFFIPHKMSIHNLLSHMYFTQMGLRPGVAGTEAVNVLFDVVPPVQMPNFLAETQDASGFMVAEPIGSRAIAGGVAERQLLSSELWDNHPCCVAVFRQDFIDNYPDAVQEFVDLLVAAGKYIGENIDDSAAIAVDFLDPKQELGLKEAVLKNVLADPKGIKTDNLYPSIEELNTIQQYMTSNMGIGRLIDIEKFVELRFADIACADDRAAGTTAAPGSQSLLAAAKENSVRHREGKYLTFDLGSECYGINIMDVREIIGLMEVTPLPQMPPAFKGVINLRDKVIPVMDIRKKFGLEEVAYNARTCIIIIEVSGVSGSRLMGCIVDSVSEVLQVAEKDIENPPKLSYGAGGNFILGLAKTNSKVTILLEIDQIMHTDELVQLAKVS